MKTIFINDVEFELVPVFKKYGDNTGTLTTQQGKPGLTSNMWLGPENEFYGYMICSIPASTKEPLNKPKNEK